MNLKSVMTAKWSKPALGAVLTVLCGIFLWQTPSGFWRTPFAEAWENASYDYLFAFGSRAATNSVVLVLMDKEARKNLQLDSNQLWPRELHAKLLNKLADDKPSLVVFDVLFKNEQNNGTNQMLADAMRKCGNVVIAAVVDSRDDPKVPGFTPVTPRPIFLDAAASWGLGHADPPTLGTARRHYPFSGPGEGDLYSLGWAAAKLYLTKNNPQKIELNSQIEHQWLRYYGKDGPWEMLDYDKALQETNGFFRNKIVFIGGWPSQANDPGAVENNNDKFSAPYTRWTHQAIGGVAIMATTFLNLINGDWLRRLAPGWELLILAGTGILLGGALCQLTPGKACALAGALALVLTLAFVSWSYFSNYWFPWLVITGGQIPCALAFSLVVSRAPSSATSERFPGYTTIGEPFGEGGYGRVWLVRDVLGHRQALKEINRAQFDDDDPYDREFRGIKNFKPISNLHLGLLHIDHVNRNDREGYFYYVMELGDAVDADWEQKGEPYRALNLHNFCTATERGRLPMPECLRIGIALLEGLEFLHQQGLVHRDIKPSNVIFAKGRPKLADVGLVRKFDPEASQVGTLPYMAPEGPGRIPADIYAFGKMLYVISTGRKAESFSELSPSVVEISGFMHLNAIICKACQPAAEHRYASATEMLEALRRAQKKLYDEDTKKI